MQGVVALEGATLAQCAETYFRVSEQTDTGIRLAVGEIISGDAPSQWRAGGVLMQRLASDQTRGDTEETGAARRSPHTLTDEELIDPALPADRLLYRLFMKKACMGEAAPLDDRCSCSAERLTSVMKTFPKDEIADLIEPDGKLHARCQFCSREYLIDPAQILAAEGK